MRTSLYPAVTAACLMALALSLAPVEALAQPVATALRLRGYAVLPEPRHVKLGPGSVRIDASWRVTTAKVADDDIAVRTLLVAMKDEGLDLSAVKAKTGPATCRAT